MTKQILNHQIALIAGALLVFPACYFVLAALLNFGSGFPAVWGFIVSIFENQANRQPGWNINLLILFGSILAFVWNVFSILQILSGAMKRSGYNEISVSVSIGSI